MATIEDRFQAAVNVIKGLPKNGPYQPSTTMMLQFYGYYKQATEGPCQQRKPGFWDIVGRAKWDAWNSNRHLTKQQAMQKYVEGLREIIETMSFTENVQNFVGSISGLDNIDLDDLEMIAPGMREIAESHPDSPFNSRTNSPQHGVSANNPRQSNSTNETHVIFNGHAPMNGHAENEVAVQSAPAPTYAAVAAGSLSSSTVEQSDDEYGDPIDIHNDLSEALIRNTEVLKQIQNTVLRMNSDIAAVSQRMTVLEKTVLDVRTVLKTKSSAFASKARQYPKWWPFEHISPGWFVLFILWPFILKRMARLMIGSKRQ